MSQKKAGIIISYINIVIGLVINIFLTPFLIRCLGDIDYSIYKVMQSFAGPLSIFHLGISTIVTRCIVRSKNSDQYGEKEKNNAIAHALISSAILSLLVLVAGFIMLQLIPSVYGKNYDSTTVALGKHIFSLYVLSSVFHVLTDVFSGCLIGHERFVISSSIPACKNILKLVLTVFLLKINVGVISVAAVDFAISLLTFLFCFIYSIFILGEHPKFIRWDKKQMVEITSFGLAIFLQAIVNQVNNSVDTMILGAVVQEKYIITMYSSALTIYSVYNSIVSAMTNFFLPKATKLITKDADGDQLTDFVIQPGRYQAMIGVACIVGFALFGKNFLSIWIGAKYLDAYYIVLLLMIPVTIPLVENAALSILDAALKRVFRSVVLVIMAVLNVIASLLLIRFLDFWGAALGTMLSLIIGHGFLMNIYYSRVFSLKIKRMFLQIFKGVLPVGIVSGVICLPLAIFVPDTLVSFIIKVISFVIVYSIGLWFFGLNTNEKQTLKQTMTLKANNS